MMRRQMLRLLLPRPASPSPRTFNRSLATTDQERASFLSVWPQLTASLARDPATPDLHPLLSPHLAGLLEYTVLGGKMNRGLAVVSSYHLLDPQCSQERLQLATVLGWTVELLQAFFLVADDIMDGSETRRGHPCWHRRNDIGPAAFNDSILLESCVYSVLREWFHQEPSYPALLDTVLQLSRFTAYGQSLDTTTAHSFTAARGQSHSLDLFSRERYAAIVKYKTSYYSFYLPVCLAMRLAGITDPSLYTGAERILLDIGHYFQATDDYLDCFAPAEVIGKIGTDIRDGKCSWVAVQALELASKEERELLVRHYGSQDPHDEATVKELFQKLGIDKLFKQYEAEFYDNALGQIEAVCGGTVLPSQVFITFLDKVYKRSL